MEPTVASTPAFDPKQKDPNTFSPPAKRSKFGPVYEKDRKKALTSGTDMKTFIVSSIAVTIAPHIGAAGMIIAPIVALILATIGKVSLNA